MKRALVLILILLMPLQTFAAAVPAFSPKVGQATGSLIGAKVQQRGFAANDPRYDATISAVGAAVTTVAAGVAVGASWPVILASAGIYAVGAVAVPLVVGAAIDWLWGPDSTAQVSGTGMGSGTVGTMPSTYPEVFADVGAGNVKYYIQPNGTYRKIWAYQGAPAQPWPFVITGPGSSLVPAAMPNYGQGGYWSTPWSQWVDSTQAKGVYEYWENGTPGLVISPSYTPAMKPIPDVVADLPQAEVNKPLTDQALADAVNRMWRTASAQPGFDGLPYDANNPITPADVSSWKVQNPTLVPTLNDYLSPAVDPVTGQVPITNPTLNPNAIPGTDPASGVPNISLGTDPGVGAPSLESTPTAASIIAPITGLMPDLKNFVVPSHSSTCPNPSMTLFGNTLVLDGHCTLLETIRPTLYAVMAFVWVVIALFIILAA